MKIAYFDCFAGASGDMILGALVNAGVPLADLAAGLSRLPLTGYRLTERPDQRGPMTGTKVDVVLQIDEDQEGQRPPRRTLATILDILNGGGLPLPVRDHATAIFRRLAAAESKVHGVSPDEVHFHEVGAVDAIVDVTGACLALHLLGVEAVYCSPLPAGDGFARAEHGVIPVPAPATVELLAAANAPLRPAPAGHERVGEMVTPTAAAIFTTLAEFRQPTMTIARVGYGIGTRNHPTLPNVLRVWLGETPTAGREREVLLLETNIDDMNPEVFGYLMELLLERGALDVWYTPIQMKKNRPGTVLSVLALPERLDAVMEIVLRESSTLGVRVHTLRRREADREVVRFASSLGPAAVKVKRLGGAVIAVAPEFEDCRQLAEAHALPLREVYRRLEAEGRAYLGL